MIWKKGGTLIGAILAILFSLFIPVVIGIVLYKKFVKKQPINNFYTPFDYITGQTPEPFHEEKEEQVEESGQDDNKK